MSDIQFEIDTFLHPHDGALLEFEISGLSCDQEKTARRIFEVMYKQRFMAHGDDPLNPGTKKFSSIFNTGEEAKTYFNTLQEWGIEFNSPAQIRLNITIATEKLDKIQGLQK